MTDSIFDTIKEAKKDLQSDKPKQWAIVLHDDPDTSFIIVLHVLIDHIGLPMHRAEVKMMEAHMKGKAVVGVYTKEIAETLLYGVSKCDATFDTMLSLTLEEVD